MRSRNSTQPTVTPDDGIVERDLEVDASFFDGVDPDSPPPPPAPTRSEPAAEPMPRREAPVAVAPPRAHDSEPAAYAAAPVAEVGEGHGWVASSAPAPRPEAPAPTPTPRIAPLAAKATTAVPELEDEPAAGRSVGGAIFDALHGVPRSVFVMVAFGGVLMILSLTSIPASIATTLGVRAGEPQTWTQPSGDAREKAKPAATEVAKPAVAAAAASSKTTKATPAKKKATKRKKAPAKKRATPKSAAPVYRAPAPAPVAPAAAAPSRSVPTYKAPKSQGRTAASKEFEL